MSDLISRQAVLSLPKDIVRNMSGEIIEEFVNLEDVKALPSAQPEPCEEVQHILDYLDNVLHPLVSPEHWNIYSELHDMIAALPSAQPERKRGKWVNNIHDELICDQCGYMTPYDIAIDDYEYSNFCPNCGCKMER